MVYSVLGGTPAAGWIPLSTGIVNLLYISGIVAFTQQAIAEWIWQGALKRSSNVPFFLVPFSAFLLWMLLIVITTESAPPSKPIKPVFYYYLAISVALGPCLHLLYAWAVLESGMCAALPVSDESEVMSSEDSRKEAECSDLVLENDTRVADPQPDPQPDSTDVELAQAPVQEKKKRESIHYITNAKIFLTILVIVHHAYNPFIGFDLFGAKGVYTPDFNAHIGALIATGRGKEHTMQWLIYGWCITNQSYFMALFFFYAGYFTPRSFDKKGRHAFLQDRLRRLGIPFVFCSFFWYPYVEYPIRQALFFPDQATVIVFYGTSVWWFLAALLSFSTIYAFLCGNDWDPRMGFPGMTRLLLSSLLLALWTSLVKFIVDPSESLTPFLVPQGMLFITLYTLAFFGGAIAQRNDWMAALRQISRAWNMAIALFSLLWFAAIQLFFGLGKDPIVDWAGQNPARGFANALLEALLMGPGPGSLLFFLFVNGFFMHFCDRSYAFWTKFFKESMYTAYIIQTVFIQIAFYTWCEIRKHDDDFELVPLNSPLRSLYYFYSTSSYMILFAGLFVSALSLIMVFPVAWCIRSIPYFDKVL